MQFLGDVGFTRVDAQPRAREPHEGEKVTSLDVLGLPYEHVSKSRVHPEWIAIGLASQTRLHTESASLVHHAFAVNGGAMGSNAHLEEEMVSGISLAGFLQSFEQEVWAPCATQVDVFGRAGSREAEFEDDAALQDDCFSQDREDAREESVEDELLT